MEFHETALQYFKDWVQNLTPVWLNCATATNFCCFSTISLQFCVGHIENSRSHH